LSGTLVPCCKIRGKPWSEMFDLITGEPAGQLAVGEELKWPDQPEKEI